MSEEQQKKKNEIDFHDSFDFKKEFFGIFMNLLLTSIEPLF